MKKNKTVSWSLMCAVIVLATASQPCGAEGSESVPANEWLIDTIDATREVGYNVSVATDPETGLSYISYYDGENGGLWLAKPNGPHFNCGPSNSWSCFVLDVGDVVGKYNSIAIGGVGPIGYYYVSYYDATNGALKVIEGTIDRATGNLTKQIHFLDRGDPGSGIFTGKHTAIVVGSSGTPHIAYQIDVGAIQGIKYATRVAPGTGNCGEGAAENDWECSHVYVEGGVGDFIAIDVDLGGNPSIVFHSSFSTNTFPILATRVGSGGSCNNSDLWNCTEVRNGGQNTGDYLAFVLGDNSLPHLAYRNENTDALEWATWVGSPNGNCGPYYDSWQCERIEGIGPGTSPAGIDIEVDGEGNPVIVYQDASSGDLDLKIARPLGGLSWPAAGNCGPLSPMFFPTWLCETLDAGDINHAEAVGGLSIAMNANGEAAVAYRELFGIPPDEGRLKIAFEPISIFLDGFETGNTTAWTETVP